MQPGGAERQQSKGIWRQIMLGLSAVAIVAAVVWLWPVVTPFFLALLLTYVLRPILNHLLAQGVPHALSVLVIYVYLITAVYAIVLLCLPIISEQMLLLFERLPQLLALGQDWLSNTAQPLRQAALPEVFSQAWQQAAEAWQGRLAETLQNSMNSLTRIGVYLLWIVLTPILAYYMLRDKTTLKKWLLSLASPDARSEWQRLGGDLDRLLKNFISGYLLVSLVMAILSAIFYWAIGVDYALALGLIMGVADLIPYFGPFLGAVPAVLVAWGHSPALALITALGVFLLQQIEGAILTPRIMGDKVGLHPLTTIFVVMAGGVVGGVLGAVLAVPVAAAALLLLRYAYSRLVGVKLPVEQ